MRSGKKKNKSIFWTAYFMYLTVIIIALLAVFFYVRSLMVEYENNSPEKYVVWELQHADEGSSKLAAYMEDHCFSGDSAEIGDAQARKNRFYALGGKAELEAKRAPGQYDSSNPVYNITADGDPFMTVALHEIGNRTKLGIMTISDWEISYAVMRNKEACSSDISEDGTFTYEITVPDGFRLYADGREFKPENPVKSVPEEFEYIAEYTAVPSENTYTVSNLSFEPVFTAVNNGGEEFYPEETAPGCCIFPADYSPSPQAKQIIEENLDPIEMGTLWSKFMTDDVGGAYHGLDTVKSECRLIEGSRLDTQASEWAHSIDITFVSGHRIDGWSNEKVDNFIQYTDKLISCDVYLEKNLTLTTAAKRTDVFNNRMFFVYTTQNEEEGWYLADMVTLQSDIQ